MGAAEDLFALIDREWLERARVEGRELESQLIDFKLVDATRPFLVSDDKRNLAKCLSGFANAAGGVVVWGVDARSGDDGLNVIRGITPFDLTKGMSALQDRLSMSVSPSVSGIVAEPIVANGFAGVIKMLVPQSELAPHMAKGGEDRFFRRVGSNFVRMEPYEIADLLGKRRRPQLQLWYKVAHEGMSSRGVLWGMIHLGLENRGRTIARFPMLRIQLKDLPDPLTKHEVIGARPGTEGLPRRPGRDGDWTVFAGTSEHVIYPGVPLPVYAVRFDVPENGSLTHTVSIPAMFVAEDHEPVEDSYLINLQSLVVLNEAGKRKRLRDGMRMEMTERDGRK